DLQLSGTDSRADAPRPRLPDEVRHRGDRSWMGAMGRGLRAALPRHVRLRPLGPQPRNAVPRPRPARRKASLLWLAWRWHARFRLGAGIAAGASWLQSG